MSSRWLFGLSLFLLVSCQSTTEEPLVKTKQSALLEFQLEYLPEASEDEAGSLHFLLTIRFREGKANGDVLYAGLQDKKDFEERVHELNFGMDKYWTLNLGDESLRPVLTHFENTYSITEYRQLHLVFAPPDRHTDFYAAPNWDIAFEDEVFNTGTHHFVFTQEEWEAVR